MSIVSPVNYITPDATVIDQMQRFGLAEALSDDITDLAINEPGYMWLKKDGRWVEIKNQNLSYKNLSSLTTAIAVVNRDTCDRDRPIGYFTLPTGERCQIIHPPCSEEGKILFALRKPSIQRFTLQDYAGSGRLSPSLSKKNKTNELMPWEIELLDLQSKGDWATFFEKCVEYKLNIVTVGGTGSGKTTFSKTLIDLYPRDRRMLFLENALELTTPHHRNVAHLFYGHGVSIKEALASCMRLNPDHIFLTELLGDESWDYLMALKSGHRGSITSVHANDCLGALYKIASYVKQSEVGKNIDFQYLINEVKSTIDVVLYFEGTYLKEAWYDPMEKLRILGGATA